MAEAVELVIKWSGNEYKISGLTAENTVSDLKISIKNETGVMPDRQKLLGLKLKGELLLFTIVCIFFGRVKFSDNRFQIFLGRTNCHLTCGF